MVCISDTHGDHADVDLPAGDILIHAGDVTANGTEDEFARFLDWFSGQSFTHRVFIAGNHDSFLEEQPGRAQQLVAGTGVTYLNDSGCTLGGVRFWGSPITPRFCNWSFMRDSGDDINRHWLQIPDSTDVLITHGPARGILDQMHRTADEIEQTGCPSLMARIQEVKPGYHVFGHIHRCYGQEQHENTRFYNVSTMNQHYRISNAPVVIDVSL